MIQSASISTRSSGGRVARGTLDKRHGCFRHVAIRFDDAMFADLAALAAAADVPFAVVVRALIAAALREVA